MRRCLQLAAAGSGYVAPNPMVGSVLVHQNKIIGEGYHRQWGGPHAEVNCLLSVKEEERHLIPKATLYISLEPCAHWGKTPPCADLIIAQQIPKVIVGCRDPFPPVNGKGIEKVRAAGAEVIVGVLEEECRALNRRFFTFHTQHRPYVILKWAQSGNGKIGATTGQRVFISNAYTARLVHKWRSEEAAILVGTNTALLDDPQLGTRLWPGKNPLRVVADVHLRLPSSLQLFDETIPTVVFNSRRHSLPFEKITPAGIAGVQYYGITEDVSLVHQLLNGLYRLNVQSLLVEGGAQLLQSFVAEGIWDEARVITNEELVIANGLPAPVLSNERLIKSEQTGTDTVRRYKNEST